ncbi:uncharacterized protein LOC143242717 isoform X2 [Tachypleus tridentatus]|uniref:uncharacterized protein LOC143242717 isoform X2 n=1 Tax=Tachypleus tridentatus TaxID=6853 RepID=UPI003FD574C7
MGRGSNPAWQYADQLHGPSTSFIPDIPPLPPFPLDDDGVTDDEALASMLMSWYMSGYHTSNYQALRQMRTESCECQEHGNKNVVFVVHHELLYQKKELVLSSFY